jgi:hypothetical protein
MDLPLIQSLLDHSRSHTTARTTHFTQVVREQGGDRIERLLDVRERRGQEEDCQA